MVKVWTGEYAAWTLELDDGKFLRTAAGKTGHHLLIGLGKPGELNGEQVRQAAAKAVKTAVSLGAQSGVLDVSNVLAALGADGLRALVQGAELALYQPPVWKEREDCPFTLFLKGAGETSAALAEAESVVRAVCFARDLTNLPANLLTPEELARRVGERARQAGVEVEVLEEKALHQLGMGAFLAVSTSSANHGRLIVLRWRGGGEEAPIALVGKAVCFDSGGYSLKPASSLKTMFFDMAGGAAAAAAIIALAENRVPVNAIALIPAVENRISPDSFLPGDIITSMSGRTIEVESTDAEGRMILADAITYAIQMEGAARIVDIASLTGATARALGWVCTGVVANDDAFFAALQAAGERCGERYWRYPSLPEYRKMCEGRAAELCNTTRDGCGGVVAGMFLERFAEGLPWLHLDIAGTAWSDQSKREYQTRGATGVGAATLYELCKIMAN